MQNRRSQFQQQPDFHITSSTILASTLHITRLNPLRNLTAPPINTTNPTSGPGLRGGQQPIQTNEMPENPETTQTQPGNENMNRVGNHLQAAVQPDGGGSNPGAMNSFSSLLLWILGGASSEGLSSFLSMFRDVRDQGGQAYAESPRQENRSTQTSQ
ncbi:hypothetical protein Ccrd_008378 [Cynara cardunculus var. scolymus]|uniref:Uncharacterized protein n=2 Tax=Cynara cardunculus var. scolymus TaxID=59895 RepID=A0A103XF75_CYNCS|nr:hypothetical protein Ccrd_008378 [Cynara cardunculus var. scolymus]